jgi:hypothetical protein
MPISLACTRKAELRSILVPGQPRQKKKKRKEKKRARHPLNGKKWGMVSHACYPSYSGKVKQEYHSRGLTKQKARLRAKRAEGMAQAIDTCLASTKP